MSKELVIGSNRHETKVAVLEDDQLVELYFQRANEYSLAGSIHKGRVTRVLPGMQSAFVDLGLERDTFLYVSDFFDELNGEEIDAVTDDKPLRGAGRESALSRDVDSSPERGREESRNRGDGRRDRAPRLGGERPGGERMGGERPAPVPPAEVERFVAAPPQLAGEELDEDDELPEVPSAPVTLAGEVRAADNPLRTPSAGGDRSRQPSDRGGDGRNRRSRRRRGRGGRGIPDNKYAQPGTESEQAYIRPEPSVTEPERAEPAAPLSDVMILPGESLAKYRSRPETSAVPPPSSHFASESAHEVPEHASRWSEESLSDEPWDETSAHGSDQNPAGSDGGHSGHEEPVAGEEADYDLEEEADSIELTDKIFGHHENEGPALMEEEKIAEVRHDHVAPEALHASSLSSPEVTDAKDPGLAGRSAAFDQPPAVPAYAEIVAEVFVIPDVAREPLSSEHTPSEPSAPVLSEHRTAQQPEPFQEAKQERLADISWSPERRAAEELFAKVVPIRDDEAEQAHLHAELLQVASLEAETDDDELPVSMGRSHGLSREEDEGFEENDLGSGAAFAAEPEAAGTDAGGPEAPAQSASLREQGGRYPHRSSSRRMRRRRGGSRPGGDGAVNTPMAGSGAAPAMAEGRASEGRSDLYTERSGSERMGSERMGSERSSEERSSERPERSDRVTPSISDLLKAGQEIIVQIAKEPLGQKGARITSHIALPGRYVVFMPSVNHLGVSRKVSSEEERQRLKRILQAHRVGTTGGFIVRTAGEGVPEDEIAADMNFLYTLWLDIRQKAEKKPAPVLLHYDLDVVQRILRDQLTEDFKAIWVDNEDLYESVLTFMQRFQPALVNRVKMYTRSAPIFDAFNITQELEKALRPKVWLKSGGYLVINQTEALVAIDINTGKYVGRSNRLEDTIVKTNTEAVKEIVRQVRLRDLGGIIVVDFIDMDERKNRQKVMQALEEAMRADKAPYKILQFNDFGLVAITRKRVKQSLERTLCAPCHYCEGAGYVKSTQTVIGEILIEAQKLAKAIEGKDVMLRVHPEVAKVLKASDNKYLEELEEILGRPVLVKGDAALHSEKFDLG